MEWNKSQKEEKKNQILIKLITNELISGEVVKDNPDTLEISKNGRLIVVYKTAISNILIN